MKNLIEQASLWLKNEKSQKGNIHERTKAIISFFRSYVQDEMAEISSNTGLAGSEVLSLIDEAEKTIRQILSAFLRGNQLDALRKTYEMIRGMNIDQLSPRFPLYKCRENSRLYHLSKDEMFHIPYEKRYMVGNQRFSLSGLPCLYLGGSSYICWEELGRKDFSTCNFCGYSLNESMKMFDMLLPAKISKPHQISRIVLVLSCSLVANREHVFKQEYILPQCVLHSLINWSYYSHKQYCIRYYSSHLLNRDANLFDIDFNNESFLSRYVNYVFPAASSKTEGYNDNLRKLFTQTETVSLFHEMLLNPKRLMNAVNADAYLLSQFGLMDAILDEKLGYKPQRE